MEREGKRNPIRLEMPAGTGDSIDIGRPAWMYVSPIWHIMDRGD